MAADLVCADCSRQYDADPDEPWRCACDGPLELASDPVPSGPAPDAGALDRDRGLWAFEELLPVDQAVSLGEGWTPLIDAPEWGASVKLEYVFPTGSFKDRGATAMLSRAAELGVERVVDDSSGNAGTAIATYAARAGIDAEIYVPAGVKPAKIAAIDRAGATAVRIEGDRAAVTEACLDAVREGTAWYASHAWNPAFFAGTATFAFEVAAQRGWSAPETVVLPAGHGTLLLGAYRGFRTLERGGWIDRVPRLIAAQAAGTAPLVEALGGDGAGENELGDGIEIESPARKSQLLDAIESTGGRAVTVGEAATSEALDELRRSGFYVEPTSAVAPAALRALREEGAIDADEDVVVPLTGSGLKDPIDS